MKNTQITSSLVTYNNDKKDIKAVIESFLGINSEPILFVMDNSEDNSIEAYCNHPRIKYFFNGANLGFGAAHNMAFEKAFELKSDYHLLLNPDVCFDPMVVKKIIAKMDSDLSIGLLMPKVLYPTGEMQYLCKLIPSPKDLILRRFIPFQKFKNKHRDKYEMRFFSYEKEAEIPIMSGCFLMIKTSVLQEVKGFDLRFFMYLEDVDLCRRIGEISKLLYYPEVKIVHNYGKGSYTNKILLIYHSMSAIKYFNKWGWFIDKERKRINKETLSRLNYLDNKNKL